MNKLEFLFHKADFSQYSDLQSRLADQLFAEKKSSKTIPFPFRTLSDDETVFVNAAQGIQPKTPDSEDPLQH